MRLRDSVRALLQKRAPASLALVRRLRTSARNRLVEPGRVFREIYRQNLWGDGESRSGGGSNAEATSHLVELLPPLFARLGIRSLLDAPCGDFWIRRVPLALDAYVGVDVVDELVRANEQAWGSPAGASSRST